MRDDQAGCLDSNRGDREGPVNAAVSPTYAKVQWLASRLGGVWPQTSQRSSVVFPGHEISHLQLTREPEPPSGLRDDQV